MYPIKLIPLYYKRIWGGDNLHKIFGRQLPHNKIGESWELCSHKNGMSVVANGELAGKTLEELLRTLQADLLGSKYKENRTVFPIMIKILDANDKLSIQVHPDNDYAGLSEQEQGKTEAWYIVKAVENAQIVYGLKDGVTKEAFSQAAQKHKVPDMLRYVSVKTGDMVFVPAGTVHAILGGVVAYEVQQTADTTYRVYDFDRVDEAGKTRELHLDKALEVINFGKSEPTDFCKSAIHCAHFHMEKEVVDGEIIQETADGFIVYCVIGGRGEIIYKDYVLPITSGETILIPACLESVMLKGQLELLKIQ